MATTSKTPAKKAGAATKATKATASKKAAVKPTASKAAKTSKSVKTVKPVKAAKAVKAVKAVKSVKPVVAKTPAKTSAVSVAKKMASKTPVVAKKSPKKPAKSAPVKTAPKKPNAKAVVPTPPKSVEPVAVKSKSKTSMTKKTTSPAAPAPAAPMLAASPPPAPRVPPRPVPVASDKDIASAHEYLLTRSAGRSSEHVVVDGKVLLTEEKLLAMPESDYMNAAQLAFFRYRLQQMEQELLSNAGETTEHLRETVIVPDPADRATIEEEHALELRTRDRERKLLKKIKSSLNLIDSGDYGYCEETGEPIGIPRLLARPTASLSLEAQQRREIKQKLFGD